MDKGDARGEWFLFLYFSIFMALCSKMRIIFLKRRSTLFHNTYFVLISTAEGPLIAVLNIKKSPFYLYAYTFCTGVIYIFWNVPGMALNSYLKKLSMLMPINNLVTWLLTMPGYIAINSPSVFVSVQYLL